MSMSNGDQQGENNTIMTVRDVAIYLRMSEAKVYRLAKEGNVPSFRLGKSWRFRRDLLEEWTRKETRQVRNDSNQF